MIGYPIVFRCCECTVEEPNLEILESHIWSRHFRKFPFSCTICDFPALNAAHLNDHFRQDHPDQEVVQFKRALDDENLLRKMVAESIVVQIFEEDDDENHRPARQAQNPPKINVLNLTEPQQIVLIPSTSNQFESKFAPHDSDEDDFGLLEDDENVEEMIEEDDPDYLDELEDGSVFIDADVDVEGEFLDDDEHIGTGNSFHLKLLRQRRLEKTINDVASEGAISLPSTSRGISAIITNQQPLPELQKPAQNTKNARLQCDICGKKFKYASKLNEHKRSHLGEKPFQCPYCSVRFSQNGALRVHIRRHTGERPFHCQWECGKTFISSSAKRLHEKSHNGERQFSCWVCGRSFLKNSHCTRHVKNIHSREFMENQLRVGQPPGGSSNCQNSKGESSGVSRKFCSAGPDAVRDESSGGAGRHVDDEDEEDNI